jgi:hypothetical protein
LKALDNVSLWATFLPTFSTASHSLTLASNRHTSRSSSLISLVGFFYITFTRLLDLKVIKEGQYTFERKHLAYAPTVFHVHVDGEYDKLTGMKHY